jgi:Rieske Fe-S protein
VEQAGAFFIDPCHGDMFSYTGNLLGGGPSGRGMDRFDVIIDADGIVVVNLKEFRNGSTRAP